jgi:Uma2 family endonuclease
MSEMGTAVRGGLITGEQLAGMSDPGPCELIDGRIVPLTPTGGEHGLTESNIDEALRAHVRAHGLGRVLVGEVGVYTQRDPDRVRAADVIFISNDRYARWARPRGFLDVPPDLVVEILSPTDRSIDTLQKLREYFAIDVRLVWVVDPEARIIYAYRSPTDVREFRETDELPGDDVLPGFRVPVAQLFAD